MYRFRDAHIGLFTTFSSAFFTFLRWLDAAKWARVILSVVNIERLNAEVSILFVSFPLQAKVVSDCPALFSFWKSSTSIIF